MGFRLTQKVDTAFGTGRVSSIMGDDSYIVQIDKSRVRMKFASHELTNLDAVRAALAPSPVDLPPYAVVPDTPKTSAGSKGLSPSLRALEALRFGLVPTSVIDTLTIGFDSIRQWTEARLPHSHNNKTTVSEVYGAFGSGKSHTMEAIRWVAKEEGYLTAKIEVDGISVTLSDPAGFLSALWPTLAAEGFHSETPVLDIYLKAIMAKRRAPSIAPRGKDRINSNYNMIRLLYQRNLIDRYAADWEAVLTCSKDVTPSQLAVMLRREASLYSGEVQVMPIIGRSVEERPYDFVESLVGMATVAKLAGFKGLAITVDEFEVEHLGPQWSRLKSVVDVLSSYLKGKLDHPDAPLSVFFATVGQSGHAGDAVLDCLLDPGEEPLECKTLRQKELLELGRRICRFYMDSYEIDVTDEADVNAILKKASANFFENNSSSVSGLTRAWCKYLLQCLDELKGPPHG